MKKLFLITFTIFLVISCKKETATYVKISGTIQNPNGKELNLHNLETGNAVKTFFLADNGSFSDTITLEKGRYFITDGVKNILLYLEPGTDLNINLDTKDFDNSLKFDGIGKEINFYISNKLRTQTKLIEDADSFFALSQEEFELKIKDLKQTFDSKLNTFKNFDKEFHSSDSIDTQGYIDYLEDMYIKNKAMSEMIGKPSPTFENYENFNGGKTSLQDLKGKYVYIDVWATWCKPCVGEIPAMKELEKAYGEKMYFVSISVDETASKETWKKMVADKEMKGIQLFANNDGESEFDTAYNISSIPRFILIDPKGNIVKPDATRPSNPKTKILFYNLLNNVK